jgi:hypothetical protein
MRAATTRGGDSFGFQEVRQLGDIDRNAPTFRMRSIVRYFVLNRTIVPFWSCSGLAARVS